ncbi:hypothetical protein SERLA73DRAFT_179750 [Serpula lacrymans var. lacrymans S7.3]|uniref:Uncharacterized protein n=2 Tax=Serpula lacrymans var. lacrymans TaxID=341189 RepID=F8PU11_SERL3|nr:uncharacterized protein SERLADRAFT_464998 [Serpula lacrymans var. lacrymans S7.9]EGN99636.1 hypothetical protein SERLA73DRAFT_179750 [Serpula lacrymans var. lacrymans S7.3]EGO25200.1 hypothetical protein SERLADRAFT_464998 [Serpula lacrymans var. lacrymans S7.9]
MYEGRSAIVAQRHDRYFPGYRERIRAPSSASNINEIYGNQKNFIHLSMAESSSEGNRTPESMPSGWSLRPSTGNDANVTTYRNEISGDQYNHVYAVKSDWSTPAPGLVSSASARIRSLAPKLLQPTPLIYRNRVFGDQFNAQVTPAGLLAEDITSKSYVGRCELEQRRALSKLLDNYKTLVKVTDDGGMNLVDLSVDHDNKILGNQYNFTPVMVSGDAHRGHDFTLHWKDSQHNYIYPGQLVTFENKIQGNQHNVTGDPFLEQQTVRRNRIQGNQYNTIHMDVYEDSFYRPTARLGDFNDIQGEQETCFLLSQDNANDLPITVVCGDLTADLAAVWGMGSAIVSDLDADSDIDRDDDLVGHVRHHIQHAIDHAIYEAARQIDDTLQQLDSSLAQCNFEIQSRVRQYLHEYFNSIKLPPWILKALRERTMTTVSAQTSFMLSQMGLCLTLPLLKVHSLRILKVEGTLRTYELEIEMLNPLVIETTQELLSPKTLKVAMLDSREYAGFNILNDLGPQEDHHHQALLLRLIRADVKQYRKVRTNDIIHVQHHRGRDIISRIDTVYVK